MNKLSLALFALLLSLAAYAGGTANFMYAIGGAGGGGGGGDINITNTTVGNNTNMDAGVSFDNNFSGSCASACGGMLETIQGGGAWTAVNNEWFNNWQAGGQPPCVGVNYEIKWVQVSGTLDNPPSDGAFTPLPENMWSFSEWSSALALCEGSFLWFGGFSQGPFFTQNGASANTSIDISIRKIDLTDGPVTATYTFTP